MDKAVASGEWTDTSLVQAGIRCVLLHPLRHRTQERLQRLAEGLKVPADRVLNLLIDAYASDLARKAKGR